MTVQVDVKAPDITAWPECKHGSRVPRVKPGGLGAYLCRGAKCSPAYEPREVGPEWEANAWDELGRIARQRPGYATAVAVAGT